MKGERERERRRKKPLINGQCVVTKHSSFILDLYTSRRAHKRRCDENEIGVSRLERARRKKCVEHDCHHWFYSAISRSFSVQKEKKKKKRKKRIARTNNLITMLREEKSNKLMNFNRHFSSDPSISDEFSPLIISTSIRPWTDHLSCRLMMMQYCSSSETMHSRVCKSDERSIERSSDLINTGHRRRWRRRRLKFGE